jgi:hypothetical protein
VEAFPFTEAEWAPIRELAVPILDAHAADDALYASLRLEMLHRLADLRERHGDHPALLETIADYTDGDGERAALYRRAVDLAVANGLPTLSIRLFFARVLLDLGQPAAARAELLACEGEARCGSERDWAGWADLLAEADAGPAAADATQLRE